MPQDLSQLGNVKVPDASELVGTSSDFSSYNGKHEELAKGIRDAFQILKNYDPKFGQNSDLGYLGFRIRSSEDVKEPLTVKVSPDNRFYGNPHLANNPYLAEHDPKTDIIVPPSQLENLIRDLMHVGPAYDTDWREVVKDKVNTSVGLQHIIGVGNDNSVGQGYPAEFLLVKVNNRGVVKYEPIYSGIRVIEPSNVDAKDSRDYRGARLINDVLTRFDATESGLYIPVGFNALALRKAVVEYLLKEINQREVRAVNRQVEREKLTSPEELAQRKLF